MVSKKTYMYYRISYSKKSDSYSTWVYVGNKEFPNWDDFGLEAECRCFRGFDEEEQKPTAEPDFVHFTILNYIKQAMRLGYNVSFSNRPE